MEPLDAMHKPLVSVIVPTYNQPAYLVQALDSVFAQTFRDFEIIVINDGSTDNTHQVLEQYGDRIRVLNQENQGIGRARNRGMDNAVGRYIAFLDHDDLWHPLKLQMQVAYMQEHPDCVGNTAPFAYSSEPDRVGFDMSIRGSNGIVPNALEVFAGGQIFVLSSALMIDREKVGDLRYAIRRQCIEDLPLQLKLLARGPFGIAGDKILVTYRMHSQNTTKSALHYDNGTRLLREMSQKGEFEPLSDRDRQAIEKCISFFGRAGVFRLLMAGLRWQSIKGYCREFPHQAHAKRLKFLFLFPLLSLIPSFILRREIMVIRRQ
jgi:glycosyltransferase involved in cell wall biosynthesis